MGRDEEAMRKRISDNSLQILVPIKSSNQGIQKSLAGVTKRIDEVNQTMAAITTMLKNIPTKRELRQHQDLMDEQLIQVEDINTRLTTAMEVYKVSELASFHSKPQAGLSGTQTYIHSHTFAAMGQLSILVYSLRDTESEISWRGLMRGEACSDGAAGRAGGVAGGADGAARGAGGAARGADEGARGAGGAAGGADRAGGGAARDPAPPPDPAPSDHGEPRGRRMSRQQWQI
jgi:hypothetical protein